LQRTRFICTLVIAGEAVFSLPFLVARVFRPTLLDVFGLTNLQLGTAFSLYGAVALLAYFPGGSLADRFSPRKLMVTALLTTSLGGLYYATAPGIRGLTLLFGFWGLSTILLFWAALIRATREWGGSDSQGTGFGLLESGRGLFAAILASLTVAAFEALLPLDVATATREQRATALRFVILIFTAMTAFVAVLVWLCIPDRRLQGQLQQTKPVSLSATVRILKTPLVWLQGLIVLCAYTGFKGADDFALYARDAFGFDDVESARLGTVSLWVRPFAALAAGLLADRIRSSHVVVMCFLAAGLGNLTIALGLLTPAIPWMLYLSVIGISAAVFGLRGIYFAMFADSRVPVALTGTAAGLISVIGYTPDIFTGPVMGYLTDRFPGPAGHQYLFGVLTAFSAAGLVATLIFRHIAAGDHRPDTPVPVSK